MTIKVMLVILDHIHIAGRAATVAAGKCSSEPGAS